MSRISADAGDIRADTDFMPVTRHSLRYLRYAALSPQRQDDIPQDNVKHWTSHGKYVVGPWIVRSQLLSKSRQIESSLLVK